MRPRGRREGYGTLAFWGIYRGEFYKSGKKKNKCELDGVRMGQDREKGKERKNGKLEKDKKRKKGRTEGKKE